MGGKLWPSDPLIVPRSLAATGLSADFGACLTAIAFFDSPASTAPYTVGISLEASASWRVHHDT